MQAPEMNKAHMNEFIWRMIRDLQNDKDFITQGMHALKMSKKDSITMQWLVAEYAASSYDLINKLKELDRFLENTNKKGEPPASTEV